jgi:hypothetical protein
LLKLPRRTFGERVRGDQETSRCGEWVAPFS